MEDLEKLLSFLVKKYNQSVELWNNYSVDYKVNMGKTNVRDIETNPSIMGYAHKYRDFLNDTSNLQLDFQELNLTSVVESRIKQSNSMQDKIDRYMLKSHDYGKVPLRKCLNDILGCRIILDRDYSFEELEVFVKSKVKNVRIVDRNLGDYKAVHVYFLTGNNNNFLWELQLWTPSNALANYKSHHKEKQDYTDWQERKW